MEQVLTYEDLDLEIPCLVCVGTPGRPKCKYCKGRGVIVTEFGGKILAFVERHLKNKIQPGS